MQIPEVRVIQRLTRFPVDLNAWRRTSRLRESWLRSLAFYLEPLTGSCLLTAQ